MSRNREALIRYRIINNCLLNGRVCLREEILSKIQETLDKPISRRTFDEDIKNMREDEGLGYLSPIVFDKEKKGYYYSDKNYSINKIPLSLEEVEALSFAASMLEHYKRIGIFEKFTGAVDKIVELVKTKRTLENDPVDLVVEFEDAPTVKGSEFIEQLIAAIRTKKVLCLHYQSFSTNLAKQYTIHPYYLKEYRNRWYLLGLENEKEEVITLGLERILSIETNPNKFYTHIPFDSAAYFKHTIGISVSNRQNTPERVVVNYSPQQALYLKTQPLHASQKIVAETNGACIMEYLLCPNYELKALFLGMGKSCRVLEPLSLVEEMKSLAKDILRTYENL